MKMKINKTGFTIIELLVVIAIIALISSVVLVSMRGSTGKAKIAKSLEFSQTILNVIGVDAVGIWTFDEGEGDYAYDKSGYGNRGTLIGKPDWVEGEENTPHWYVNEGEGRYALEFNGASDYINCGSNSSLNNLEKFTLSAWIFMDERKYIPTIINKGPERAAQHIWWGIRNNDTIFLEMGDSGGWVSYSSSAVSWSLDRWYYVVLTFDNQAKEVKHYQNGKHINTISTTGRNLNSGSYTLSIGRYYGGYGPSSYHFNGKIDEVRIYASALDSAEIQQHYADGAKKHNLAFSAGEALPRP